MPVQQLAKRVLKSLTNHLRILAIPICILVFSCSSGDDDEPSYTNARNFFNEIHFSGSVLLSRDGTEILREGFGYANRSTQEANVPTTRFRIGSVSKTLTGMGIVQLKRDGLIENFDQQLSDFMPEFPYGDEITLRQLMSHQSGIPDYLADVEPLARQGQAISPEAIALLLVDKLLTNGPNFSPGTQVEYSNSNYLLLALLIQELSGESYEDYIESQVLAPLGMNSTLPGTDQIQLAGYAHGYRSNTDVSSYPMAITLGAGNWTSTVDDLQKWCQAAMSPDWFTAEEKEAIFGGDIPLNSTAFGLAWFKSNISGKKFLWHSGSIDGFSSIIGFLPESNGIVITLSNEEDNTGAIQNAILETILTNEF